MNVTPCSSVDIRRHFGGTSDISSKCINITHRITGVSDFIHRPDFNNYKKKEHDVSETGSVSVLR
jgi:hypothetical protein